MVYDYETVVSLVYLKFCVIVFIRMRLKVFSIIAKAKSESVYRKALSNFKRTRKTDNSLKAFVLYTVVLNIFCFSA